MSTNYSKSLARDKGGEAIQNVPPPNVALKQYTSENATVSSVISFTHDTTAIEIAAISAPAAIKFIAQSDTQASIVTAVSGANYDYVIPTGTVRRFVLPFETQGTPSSSMVGINRGAGLYQRVAYKSMGVASVMATEY